jgi:hypothetical protein
MATRNITSVNPIAVTIPGTRINGGAPAKGGGNIADPSQLQALTGGKGRAAGRQAERQAQRTNVNIGEPRPTHFRNTPENHARMIGQIKKQQEAHGVEVKMRDATAQVGTSDGPNLPDAVPKPSPGAIGWLDAAWAKYVPSILAGADAASTDEAQESCAVDGTCDVNPASSPATLAGLRHDAAAAGFTFKASPSLLARKDPSLKGVLILIADMSHEDGALQQKIGALIGRHIRPGGFFSKGDIMSVETTSADSYARTRTWCRGQEPSALFNLYSAPCIGIDSAEEVEKILAALTPVAYASQDLLTAMAKHGDVGAATALAQGGVEGAAAMDALLRSASKEIQKAVASETAAFDRAYEEYETVLMKTVPARDANFVARIAERADPEVANFAPLGGLHIANIMDHFLAAGDTVVLAPRDLLIKQLNNKDANPAVPKKTWALERWTEAAPTPGAAT